MSPAHRPAIPALSLVVALALAGCSAEAPEKASPESALEGWVLDWLLRPVDGASVQIVGGNGTLTDDNGYYAFRDLPVGTYTIQVRADGMQATAGTTSIDIAGQNKRLNFSLAPTSSKEARILTEQFNGFIECSAFVTAEHSHGGSGRPEGDNPLDCGTYSTTNSVWEQEVPPGIDSAVIEVFWEPDTALADRLLIIVDQVMPDGSIDYITFGEGASPLKVQIPFLVAEERFTAGGTLLLDVQIGGSEDDIAAGAAIQEEFTAFTSYFWNTLPDPEYTVG